jgi:hypothetical protein
VRRILFGVLLWMGVGLRAFAADAPAAASTTAPTTAPPTTAPIEVALPEAAATAEEQPRDKPDFTAKLVFDNALGSGVLDSHAYAQNPAYTINIYGTASYNFAVDGHKLKASAREIFTFYPRLDNTAGSSRRVDWSDLWLTISDSKIYEEPHTHIKLGASLRGIVPLSYTSRYATLITAIAPGISLSKSVYRLDLSAGFAVQKNFFRSTSVQTPCTGEVPITLNDGTTVPGFNGTPCRPGDPSAPTPTATAMNADFSLIPSASGTYHFTDKLSLSLSFYYFDSFLYPVPVDGFSSQYASSNGRTDAVWGITSLDYSLDEHWGLSLGVWNNSSPRGPNAQSYNFPFADFTSLATNSFIFFFDISATI